MSPVDFVILGLVAAAFVAVVLRVRKKGACGDCPGSCSGCSSAASGCPAARGLDEVSSKLGKGISRDR